MKFPGDKENNLPSILDPKTPDLLDSVLADIVRNMLGMGYCSAVDPATINVSQSASKKVNGSSPREAISSFKTSPQNENIAEIKKILLPFSAKLLFPEQLQDKFQKFFQIGVTEFQEQHNSWHFSKGDNQASNDLHDSYFVSNPSIDQVTNSASPRAAIDNQTKSSSIDNFNPEPESLLDIFFNKDSPFNLLSGSFLNSEKIFKGDSDLGYDVNHPQQNSVTTWSSVSVVTNADGITKTRKTIRRADGTEETTETIFSSYNNQQLPNKIDNIDLPSADPSRIQSIILPKQSPGVFDSFVKWWGQLLA